MYTFINSGLIKGDTPKIWHDLKKTYEWLETDSVSEDLWCFFRLFELEKNNEHQNDAKTWMDHQMIEWSVLNLLSHRFP